jgi:hypothetical protein
MTTETLHLPKKRIQRMSARGDAETVEQAIERQTVHAPQFGPRFKRPAGSRMGGTGEAAKPQGPLVTKRRIARRTELTATDDGKSPK